MSNPYVDRMSKRGTSGHGRLSENRVAGELGARVHPASGAMRGFKSDASDPNFQYEMKSTTNQTLALDKSWLEKISHEANSQGKVPAVSLSFVTPEGKPQMKLNADWVAIPLWKFRELTNL